MMDEQTIQTAEVTAGGSAIDRLRRRMGQLTDYTLMGTEVERAGGVGWAWAQGILRARPIEYALGIATYSIVCFLLAGSNGSRGPLRGWLMADSTSSALIIQSAGWALAVGILSSLIAIVARSTQAWPPRVRPWYQAWAFWRPWPWLVGLAFTLGAGSAARIDSNPGASGQAVIWGSLALVLIAPLAVVGLSRVGRSPRMCFGLGMAIGTGAVVVRVLSGVLPGGSFASGAAFGVAAGEVTRALAAIGVALSLSGVGRQYEELATGRVPMRQIGVGLFIRLLPTLLMIGVLAVAEDYGPALILGATATVLTLVAYSRNYWLRASAFTGTLALGFGWIGWQFPALSGRAQQVIEERVNNAACSGEPITQACKSLRILHTSGLLSLRKFGSSQQLGNPMTRHLEVARSDYAITTAASYVGMALVALVIIGLLAVALRLIVGGLEIVGSSERSALRTRIAVTAGLSLLLPTAILSWSILIPPIPGLNKKLPLTGLDVPFIAANGMSTMVYCAMLALGVLAARPWPIHLQGPAMDVLRTPTNKVLAAAFTAVVAVATAAATVIGAVWIHLGWGGAGSIRLNGEALLRDTAGTVRTRDGKVFSEPNAAGKDPTRRLGERLYPEPDLAVDLGFFLPGASTNSAVGLEYLAAPLLTCGDYRPGGSFGVFPECNPADVISTVDSRIQRKATARAKEYAKAGARADLVVLDRQTGQVVTLASSDASDKAMQDIITKAPTATEWEPVVVDRKTGAVKRLTGQDVDESATDDVDGAKISITTEAPVDAGWVPPTLLIKRSLDKLDFTGLALADKDPQDWAAARARFAMTHLKESAVRCFAAESKSPNGNPRRPDEGWSEEIWPEETGPSRQRCNADKAGLGLMRVWSEATQPGSTFKLVTALAQQEENTGYPPGGLSSPLTEVKGQRLVPPIPERTGLSGCPKQTLDWMLLKSCNTTAAWMGVAAGWPALNRASAELGMDPQDADSTPGQGITGESQRDEGGAIVGPADPSSGDPSPALVYYRTSQMGDNPAKRKELLADGTKRDLPPDRVASAVGWTAIGQDLTRASVLDIAGVTSAIVGAGPLSSASGPALTTNQTLTEYRPPRALTLIAGSCTPERGYSAFDSPERSVKADPDNLANIRRGMWWAVHDTAGTVNGIAPDATAARPLRDTDVIWGKSGSADLDDRGWARWVTGATSRYVFAARVEFYSDGGGKNPATQMMGKVLADIAKIPPADPAQTCK